MFLVLVLVFLVGKFDLEKEAFNFVCVLCMYVCLCMYECVCVYLLFQL